MLVRNAVNKMVEASRKARPATDGNKNTFAKARRHQASAMTAATAKVVDATLRGPDGGKA